MNIHLLLQDRSQLIKILSDLGFKEDIPAIMDILSSRVLFEPSNLRFLERSRAKYAAGEKFTPEDWNDITLDRRLLQITASYLFARLISARHKDLGLPPSVTTETVRGIGRELFEALAEYPEALWHKLGWTSHYSRNTMFKTGIFVYQLERISEKLPVWVYKERVSGKVAALAAEGVEVNSEGLVCQKNIPPKWVAKFAQTSTTVSGNYVDPSGYITQKRLSLSLKEWENVLAPGDLTAGIHIPPGCSMTGENCKASLQKASEVIQKYLSRLGIRSFTCMSWVFSPEWRILLPESNLARLAREVYLFPIYAAPTAGINFVFRKAPEELDLRTAPRQTRLQRIMLERLEEKKPLYAGGMFMLLEDVDQYGAQHYLTSKI